MLRKFRNLLVTLAALLVFAVPALAQTQLAITCRCVADGVNSAQVQWLNEFVIPEFEKMMADQGNPVEVQLIEFGGSDEGLKEQYALDLSVGAGADVLGFDGFWIPEFVSANLLKPLDELAGGEVNDWEGWNRISLGLQELMGVEGKRYGIALGTDSRMIFYRKDMFREAGVRQWWAWQPRSWADVLEAARMIKETFPDAAVLQLNAGTAMGEATTMQGYFMVLLGTGEHMVTEDGKWIVRSPGILDALNFYKQVYVDENLGDARVQLLQDGRNRSFANFRDGNTAMLVEGDWFYRSVTAPGKEFAVTDRDVNMGWAAMPAKAPGEGLRGQDFVSISGGTGFVLNPNTTSPQEAWELLAFMNSQEALMAFQGIQPRIRVRDDVPVPENAFLTTTAQALLPLSTARPLAGIYPEVSFQAQLMTERVVSGEMSPEEAMNAYAEAVTELVGADNVIDLMP